LGDYLIVGIHNDQIVNQKKGLNYPIMTLHERTLSVLGCRHVDDVLIDAPYSITQEMLSSLHIQVVARACPAGSQPTEDNVEDPFALPRSLGMLTTVYINHTVTGETLTHLISSHIL
jgi:ethanolamine-phosphate cytidylyltransferase